MMRLLTRRRQFSIPNVAAGLVGFLLTVLCAAPARGGELTAVPLRPINGAAEVDLASGIEWTTVPEAEAYYLYVGSVVGAKDLLDTGQLHQTRYLALQLPAGTLVYARLWTKAGGAWRYVDFSFATASTAAFGFLHPSAGDPNGDLTRPFEWRSVPEAQAYYLYVGTTPGGNELVNSGEIGHTSYLAFNLPLGVPLYSRIWAKVRGSWQYVDSSFAATASASAIAQLLHPSASEANADLTVPIRWAGVPNAQAYYLYVGSTRGARDLLNSGEIQATSYPAPGLPAGPVLWARLWTKAGNVWRYADTSFTVNPAAAGMAAASFTYPGDGASDVDPYRPLRWTTIPNAEVYYLYVGTAPGLYDVIDSKEIRQASYSAMSLPANRTLYARLYTKSWGVWRYTEIAFTVAKGLATLITPIDGATRVDPTRAFEWTSVPFKQSYYLYVGSAPGANDLIDSEETQVTSWSPLDGGKSIGLGQIWTSRTLFARLWTKVDGRWRHIDTSFATATLIATFVSPADQSVGLAKDVTFTWTKVPGAQKYRLTVEELCTAAKCDKDRPGKGRDDEMLLDTGAIDQTSFVVRHLPQKGRLRGRIWTQYGGVWRYSEILVTREQNW